ncbi:uncharacterized protein LOC128954207 [Oppia nitens]|uniref:uncharacterized protein LOC128954207 n=1 Tax=Oppia nitens TaxID=1686743 RepID=UPI0023DB1E01|nr:uncharacterized protein LOC128954207 [Oppia nitens]
MKFLMKLSPRKKKPEASEDEMTTAAEESETEAKVTSKKREKSIKSAKSGRSGRSVGSRRSRRGGKAGDGGGGEADEEDIDGDGAGGEKVGFVGKLLSTICPCVGRRREPEIMEYESGSAPLD